MILSIDRKWEKYIKELSRNSATDAKQWLAFASVYVDGKGKCVTCVKWWSIVNLDHFALTVRLAIV